MAQCFIGLSDGRRVFYNMNDLTRHAVVLGTTGSGKTVMAKVLIEEALIRKIPVIAIDPKGDLGTLAVANKNFDFRPFADARTAGRQAALYKTRIREQDVDAKGIEQLASTKTTIYTPKSGAGVAVSMIPNLAAPQNFAQFSSTDLNLIADFVEPVSESVAILANIRGTIREKAQSLISSILVKNWNEQKDLTIETLLSQVVNPPFEKIGSLPVEEFLKEKERRQIAASLNLIISSPAKNAWKYGEPLRVEKMLHQGNLSVFDLRFATTTEEKQYVVEQLLSELYRFMLRQGSSERLRYLLYIDELAGLLPPPPASPPSKKLLELLIRQARAFGLGIMVATQSPGDIDYRIFGNLGTRFIGRLRTVQEIEKMATAMNLKPTQLIAEVSNLKTGDFVYHNAIQNFSKVMHGRWLLGYHGGPLKPQELGWINNADSRPAVSGELRQAALKKTKPQKITAKSLVKPENTKVTVERRHERAVKLKESQTPISKLVHLVKMYTEKTRLLVNISEAKEYVPHLKIVIMPKQVEGLEIGSKSYNFDLTLRIIPLSKYLTKKNWSQYIPRDAVIAKPKVSIKGIIRYAVQDALPRFKTRYYQSRLMPFNSVHLKDVEYVNIQYLNDLIEPKLKHLGLQEKGLLRGIDHRIKFREETIKSYARHVTFSNTGRVLKRIFTGKRLSSGTKELRKKQRRIAALRNQCNQLKKQAARIRKRYSNRRMILQEKAEVNAHRLVRELVFEPKRKDVVVQGTILLVPKPKSEV